jgi:hypothetical protein
LGALQLPPGTYRFLEGRPKAGTAYTYLVRTSSNPLQLLKVNLTDPCVLPRVVATLTLNKGERTFVSGRVDIDRGYALIGTGPGHIVGIELGEGDNAPTRAGLVNAPKRVKKNPNATS